MRLQTERPILLILTRLDLVDYQLATACRQMPPGLMELERAKAVIFRADGRFAVILHIHLD